LEQRSFISEIILVVIVAVFVVSCAAVVNAVHRGLPQAATLAAAETPFATATPVPTPPRQLVLSTTSTAAKPPTPVPAKPTATAGPNLAQYLPVTGAQLNSQPDQYTGKKVLVTGSVYYVNPRGENTWVQVLTQDNVYVDINFTGPSTVQKDQQVKVYGTAAGKTTVQVKGVDYAQPYLNPGDIIQQA
jgi:hypothetical protein